MTTEAANQAAQKTIASMMESLTQGQVPSNVQVSESLGALRPGEDVDRSRLTETGKQVTSDIDRLVEDTQRIFLEKNREENLQQAAIHASRAAEIARRHELVTSKEAQEAMEEARQGMMSAINVARLMVTSDEFRREVVEALGIIQQGMRRRTAKPSGKKEMTTGEQRTEERVTGEQQGPVGLRRQAGEQGEMWSEESEEEEEEEEAGAETTTGGTTTGGTTMGEGGFQAGKSMPLSENEQDALAERFFRLMKDLQHKPEYQQGIRFLIEKARSAYQKGGIATERMQAELTEKPEGRQFLRETQLARDEALQLVENWTSASLDPLFERMNLLSEKMRGDDTTKNELERLASFVEKCLTGSEMTDDKEKVKEEAKQCFNRVREQLMTSYQEPLQRMMDEVAYLRDEFRDDEAAQVLKDDVSRLVDHMVYDEQGQPKVKVELIKDLQVLFSALIRKVQWVPIQRVAMTTPDYDFMADQIVVNIRELTPDQIRFETLTQIRDYEREKGVDIRQRTVEVQDTREGVRSTAYVPKKEPVEPIEAESTVRIELSGIHSDLRDIKWYYKKKTGLLQEADRGHADLKIYGRGMTIWLDIKPSMPVATKETPVAHAIEVVRCDAKIHKMSLRVWDSKHDWMYAIFKPIIKSQIRKAVEQGVADYMRQYVMELDKNVTQATAGQYPVTKPLAHPHEQRPVVGTEMPA